MQQLGVSQHPAEFRMVDHGLVEKAIINHDRIPPAGAHSLGHILVDTDKDVDAIAFACILETDSNRVRRAQCLDADDVGSRLGRQFAKGAVDTCRESKALDEPYEAVQVLGGNQTSFQSAISQRRRQTGEKRRPIREIEILRQLMSRSESLQQLRQVHAHIPSTSAGMTFPDPRLTPHKPVQMEWPIRPELIPEFRYSAPWQIVQIKDDRERVRGSACTAQCGAQQSPGVHVVPAAFDICRVGFHGTRKITAPIRNRPAHESRGLGLRLPRRSKQLLPFPDHGVVLASCTLDAIGNGFATRAAVAGVVRRRRHRHTQLARPPRIQPAACRRCFAAGQFRRKPGNVTREPFLDCPSILCRRHERSRNLVLRLQFSFCPENNLGRPRSVPGSGLFLQSPALPGG